MYVLDTYNLIGLLCVNLQYLIIGFVWSIVIFSKNEISKFERLLFSYVFGIGIISFILFINNIYLGIKITITNTILIDFLLIIIPLIIKILTLFKRKFFTNEDY